MLDLFAPTPKDLRRARLRKDHDYLVDRDGEMNVNERTLSKRETLIANYESKPALTRAMDEAEFRRQYVAFDKRKRHDPELLLLLSLVKVNSAEAYGVARNFQRVMSRALKQNDEAE